MRRLMQWLLLSCKKATELIEKRSFIGLKFWDRVRLKWHLKLCEACARYEAHSKHMDHLMGHTHKTSDSQEGTLPDAQALKERLLQVLHQQNDQ